MKKIIIALLALSFGLYNISSQACAPNASGTDKESQESTTCPPYIKFVAYEGTKALINFGMGYALIKAFGKEISKVVEKDAKKTSELMAIRQGVKSTTKLSSIVGKKPAEFDHLIDMIDNPKSSKKLNAPFPKGIFMYGPPGTGKTVLARALANKLNATFIEICGSQLESKWIGDTSKNISALFDLARNAAPTHNSQNIYAVIFIDEIDSIASNRENNIQAHYTQGVDTLLSEMTKNNEHILIIGASNHQEKVDKAILRSGRFDIKIKVELPTSEDRLLILKHYTQGFALEREEEFDFEELCKLGSTQLKKGYTQKYPHLLKPAIDFIKLAKNTAGFSGADLEELCNKAARHAAEKKQECIKQENFEAACGLMQQEHESQLKRNW